MALIYGIDLSKKKFDVSLRGKTGDNIHKVIKNNLDGIVKFLNDLPDDAMLCAEHTGVYGDLLLYLCGCLDIPIALATGYQIRHSLGLLKGKSDKIDSIRIREYGERFGDKLTTISFPTEAMCELKVLFKLRSQLVQERKMLITHEKRTVHMPYNSLKAHRITQSMIECLNCSISDLETEIRQIIESDVDLRRNYNLITDIIGIGPVTTCDLIVKTGNFKMITTARKAASYSGVCPFPNSSGTMVKKSRVSHMADKELKSLLYLCAVSATRKNPEYRLYFERKKLESLTF